MQRHMRLVTGIYSNDKLYNNNKHWCNSHYAVKHKCNKKVTFKGGHLM